MSLPESAEDPVVSVVIPTFNRADLLEPLAGALAAQEGVPPFEVVFVDDGSDDWTAAVLTAIASRQGWPENLSFRVLRSEQNTGSPARTRNLGWRSARAPLIAFLDDDCTPSPRWLAELVAALADADVVQGLVEVDQSEALRMGPFGRILVITEFSWKFETCNIGYRRETLEALGGFDERYGHFGEDTDLGLRAVRSGARVRWWPAAFVLHRVEFTDSRLRDWVGALRYARRCQFAALLVQRHPDFRRHLFWRCFYKPYHASTLGALAGFAALVGKRPVAAAALTGPWLHHRLRVNRPTVRRRWLWAVLPMALAVDVAEVASTVTGAVRYRTFLL